MTENLILDIQMKYNYIQFRVETLEIERLKMIKWKKFFISILGLVMQFLVTLHIPIWGCGWISSIPRG